MKFIAVEVIIHLFIYLFIFDYSVQFVCIKDRPCLRRTITAKRLEKLFTLLERKLILGSKTQEKSISSIFSHVVSSILIFEILFFQGVISTISCLDLRFAKRENINKKVDVN